MSERLPLEGIRVLDIASWIAAPAAAVVLGDFGADVIKVEPPGEGDPHRMNYTLPQAPKSAVNYPWHLDSRNKRSIALDLKSPAGRAALDRLIARADVLITNFPFPVRTRLKLTYDDVRDLNARLIYASFTGYGEDGPDKDEPGFDANAYFARSGLFDRLRYEGNPPGFAMPAQGDRAAAMGLVSAILLALYDRERTGQGRMVASSLYANGLWSNAFMAQAALIGAYAPLRPPRERPLSALANIYQSRDGRWFQLSIVQAERHWPTFCELIGRPELLQDRRFAALPDRRRHAAELRAILDDVFASRDYAAWHELLSSRAIPHAPIAQMTDIPEDPQAVAARAVVPTAIDELPRTIASPFQLAGVEQRQARPAPSLGADTDAILAEAGFTKDEIASLKATGAAA
jgi:formyl-CoA transferase